MSGGIRPHKLKKTQALVLGSSFVLASGGHKAGAWQVLNVGLVLSVRGADGAEELAEAGG